MRLSNEWKSCKNLVRTSAAQFAMMKQQISSAWNAATHFAEFATKVILKLNLQMVPKLYFVAARSILANWSSLRILLDRFCLLISSPNIKSTFLSLSFHIINAPSIVQHRTAKVPYSIHQWSRQTSSASVVTIFASSAWKARIDQSHATSWGNGTRKSMWAWMIQRYGWSWTRNHAPSARCKFRRTRDACTWHVLNASTNFVGFAWVTINSTRLRLVATCATLMKMLLLLTVQIRAQNKRSRNWNRWCVSLVTSVLDTLSTTKPLVLHKRRKPLYLQR